MSDFWPAASAMAACFAAIVALVPIYNAASARRAKARNLRLQIASKIVMLKPTLRSFIPSTEMADNDLALNREAIEKQLSQIRNFLSQSENLQSDEQDSICIFCINLELAIPLLYSKTLTQTSIESLLMLGDTAIREMEENGLVKEPKIMPWHGGAGA